MLRSGNVQSEHVAAVERVQTTIVVIERCWVIMGFRLEEGILSGRHHALPTPYVPSVLTFTFRMLSHVCVANYGYGYPLERNSLYPYVGDRLVASHRWSRTTSMVSF